MSNYELLEKYESHISRHSTPGVCHLWDEKSIHPWKTIFKEAEGVVSFEWKWSVTQGNISSGKRLWRVCQNPLCHNEQHWMIDKVLSRKTREDIRLKMLDGTRTWTIAQEYGISIPFVGLIKSDKKADEMS